MTAGPPFAWEAPQQAQESADFAHSQYLGCVVDLGGGRMMAHIPVASSRYLGTL